MASLERNLPLETYELSVRASKRQMSSLILPDAEENVTAIPCSKMTRIADARRDDERPIRTPHIRGIATDEFHFSESRKVSPQ